MASKIIIKAVTLAIELRATKLDAQETNLAVNANKQAYGYELPGLDSLPENAIYEAVLAYAGARQRPLGTSPFGQDEAVVKAKLKAAQDALVAKETATRFATKGTNLCGKERAVVDHFMSELYAVQLDAILEKRKYVETAVKEAVIGKVAQNQMLKALAWGALQTQIDTNIAEERAHKQKQLLISFDQDGTCPIEESRNPQEYELYQALCSFVNKQAPVKAQSLYPDKTFPSKEGEDQIRFNTASKKDLEQVIHRVEMELLDPLKAQQEILDDFKEMGDITSTKHWAKYTEQNEKGDYCVSNEDLAKDFEEWYVNAFPVDLEIMAAEYNDKELSDYIDKKMYEGKQAIIGGPYTNATQLGELSEKVKTPEEEKTLQKKYDSIVQNLSKTFAHAGAIRRLRDAQSWVAEHAGKPKTQIIRDLTDSLTLRKSKSEACWEKEEAEEHAKLHEARQEVLQRFVWEKQRALTMPSPAAQLLAQVQQLLLQVERGMYPQEAKKLAGATKQLETSSRRSYEKVKVDTEKLLNQLKENLPEPSQMQKEAEALLKQAEALLGAAEPNGSLQDVLKQADTVWVALGLLDTTSHFWPRTKLPASLHPYEDQVNMFPAMELIAKKADSTQDAKAVVAELEKLHKEAKQKLPIEGKVWESLVIKGAERVASHEADPLLESPLYRDHDGSLKRKAVVLTFSKVTQKFADAEADLKNCFVAFSSNSISTFKPDNIITAAAVFKEPVHRPVITSNVGPADGSEGSNLVRAVIQMLAASLAGRALIYYRTQMTTEDTLLMERLRRLSGAFKDQTVGTVWTKVEKFFTTSPRKASRGSGCMGGSQDEESDFDTRFFEAMKEGYEEESGFALVREESVLLNGTK